MKHLIVFQAFFNVKETIQSFESMYLEGIDYFIVENISKYSDEIKEYFKEKRLKGYIQFEENIGSNAMTIFKKDFWSLLKSYDLITITEGDLYIYDIVDSIKEVKFGLKDKNNLVSAIGLYMGNVFNEPHRKIGLEHYIKFMENRKSIPHGNGYGGGGIHFLTFRNDSIDVIKDTYFGDYLLYEAINKKGRGVTTNKNKAYHLTWDLLAVNPITEYNQLRTDIDTYERNLGCGSIFLTTKECGYKRIV